MMCYSAGKGTNHISLEKPAKVGQLSSTIKEIALITGVLVEVSVHSLRYGFARDMADIPASAWIHVSANNLNTIRAALGHTHHTMNNGVTDDYIRDAVRYFHSERAAARFIHLREPMLAEDVSVRAIIRAPLTAEEVRPIA